MNLNKLWHKLNECGEYFISPKLLIKNVNQYSYYLYCKSLVILNCIYIHWHTGTNPNGWPLSKFYPNFRFRKFEIFGFQVPFIKYYDV